MAKISTELRSKLAGVEAQVASVNTSVGAVSDNVKDLAARIATTDASNVASLKMLTNIAGQLAAKVSKATAKIEALGASLDSTSRRIA